MIRPESTPYPDAQRLANRLRMLADEIESAARFGVPIPSMVNVEGHEYGYASFSATEEEFAAWVEYVEANVIDYEYHGLPWSMASVDVNGLPMRFAVQHKAAEVAS